MAEADMTVGLFCRVSPAAREVLSESLRGINASRALGEAKVSLGALVERCIVETLGGGEPAAAPHKTRKGKRK